MKYNKKQYYQNIKEQFIGASIQEVYYEVLNTFDESDTYLDWEISQNIHSIDMNIIFKLDNGKLIQLFWDSNFYCYGIGLEVLSHFEEKESIKLINVSENVKISGIIGYRISDILVSWDILESYDVDNKGHFDNTHIARNYVPTLWQILFNENINMWIATLEISDNKDPYHWADHLTVFFNRTEIVKYKLELENVISVNSVTK